MGEGQQRGDWPGGCCQGPGDAGLNLSRSNWGDKCGCILDKLHRAMRIVDVWVMSGMFPATSASKGCQSHQ